MRAPRAIAAAAVLLASAAFGQGRVAGGGASVTWSALADSAVPGTDNSINLGSLTKRWATIYVPAIHSGASNMTFTSTVADDGNAVAFSFNCPTLADGSAVCFRIRENGVTLWEVDELGDIVPQGNQSIGNALFALGNVYTDDVSSASGTGITFTATEEDDANAVAFSFNGPALANAAAILWRVRENGTTRWLIDEDGHLLPGADNTYAIGASGSEASAVWTNGLYLNGFVRNHDTNPRIIISDGTSTSLWGDVTASGVAVRLGTVGTLLTSGKILELYADNESTLKFEFDFNGSMKQVAATLRTCAAGTEGLITRDAAAGGSTGARTRYCLCTSDGGGSPAYAWQNLVTGTVGTTTTCSP